jgi:outer membrane protein assembly factor BamD (BamD/ComL family)
VTRLMVILLLVSINLAGCARIIGGQDTELYRAEGLLRERNYPEAITAYREIAKETDSPERAANAQFSLASALAYYDNPQKDYALALQEFDQFLKLYPDAEKAVEAQQWRSLLRMIVELDKKNENLNKNIEQYKHDIEQYKHDVEQYKQNIEHLNRSIEQLKQLDIQHEERRRK